MRQGRGQTTCREQVYDRSIMSRCTGVLVLASLQFHSSPTRGRYLFEGLWGRERWFWTLAQLQLFYEEARRLFLKLQGGRDKRGRGKRRVDRQ